MTDDYAQFDFAHEICNAESCKPWRSGLYSRTLIMKEDLRVVLFTMEPGAILKEHQADGTITVHVLCGEIIFSAQERARSLRIGQMLTLGKSIKHAVESVGDSAFLLTISSQERQSS